MFMGLSKKFDTSHRMIEARELFDSGDFDRAERQLAELLTANPDFLDALVLLGVVRAKKGNLDQAAESLGQALLLDPNHLDALTWLANVRRSQDRNAEAIGLLLRVLGIRPQDVSVRNLLGLCYLATGQAKFAQDAYEAAIGLDANSGQLYHNLGLSLQLQSRNQEALSTFEQAVKLAPEHPGNFLQIFKHLQLLSRWSEGIHWLKRGLTHHPGSTALLEALASAYGRTGETELAEDIFRKISPQTPSAAVSYANYLQESGQFDQSVQVLQASLSRFPTHGASYHALTDAKCFEWSGTTLIDRAQEALADPRVSAKDRMHLSYALGKAYDFRCEYQRAMGFFDDANNIAFRTYPACRTFNEESILEKDRLLAEMFTPEFMDRFKDSGSSSETPVFVVGMVRSGTTLLDRILSSHPDVGAAGELPFWTVRGGEMVGEWMRREPTQDEIISVGNAYLSVLEGPGDRQERVVDKMPLNFAHLGLIRVIFPKVRIIHIKRHSLDTCLSIYMTFFAGGPNFAYNRSHIVAFYRSYLRQMEHWRTVLPKEHLYEVDYESLVSDQERVTRELIEFCGLSWSDRCLHPEQKKGAVSTPSRWQARQPIYKSSVDRWRHYEPWLGEFGALVGT